MRSDRSSAGDWVRPPNLSENVELALREEIRTAQASQSDLIKWKLIAVAAVGAISLGLPGSLAQTTGTQDFHHQLLSLIPLICLYVDLICLNYTLRCITIGTFIKASYRQTELPLLDYEGFVSRSRDMFNLEEWAILWSSRGIDVFVSCLVAVLWYLDHPWSWASFVSFLTSRSPVLFSSVVGIVGTSWMHSQYKTRISGLKEVSVSRRRVEPADSVPVEES